MNVPFFDYTRVYSSEGSRYDAVLHDVLYRSDFILRSDLVEFEQALANYCGVKHAIGVANGTDAIWLSLMAVGVKPGDEVILPSHTYIATAGAVKLVGAIPVLVDCADDHLIDPVSVEKAITPKTTVVIPVQLNGRTAHMDPLVQLARDRGLTIVEDSAQGLGSRYDGKMAGTFGTTGTYSFFPAKVLGCFGDGGAVVTDSDEIGTTIRQLRDHGRDDSGQIQRWGFNSRLDNIQAAVLLEKLKSFERDVSRRRAVAGAYDKGLSALDGVFLPPSPDSDAKHFDTYQNYEMECLRRDELKAYLSENGIGTLIQWGGSAVHQIPTLGLPEFSLPRTELLFERAIMLPMNQYLTDDEVDYVIGKVREFYGK